MRVSAKPETGIRAQMRSKGYLPAVEAADRLGFTAQTIYDWLDAEKINGARLGAARWVEWASVKEYLRQQSPETAKLLGL